MELHTIEIISTSSEKLGDKVISLAQEGVRITGTLD